MKKFLLLATFIMIAVTSVMSAPVEKQRMLIEYFTSESQYRKHVDAVRNQVVSGIQATNRLIVIDVNSESSLQLEEARRSEESAMSDDVARQGTIKSLGANYMIVGTIDGIAIEKKKTDSGTVYYDATLNFTLKTIDVSNGSLHASKSYTTHGGGSLLGAGSTEAKALSGAVSLVGDRMTRMIDELFPLNGNIVEMKEAKKNKMISCFIDLGIGHGLSAGQYIKVSKVTEIAGRKSVVEIGRLKIEECVAEDLSDCKVIKGGEEIFAAFSNQDELVVETIKARGLTGALNSISD